MVARPVQVFDVSGAIQTATNWQTRKANEVEDAENMRFDKEIGSAQRRNGYTLTKALASNKTPLGFFEAKFSTGVKIFYAYNNTGNTNTVLSCYDPVANTTTIVKSDYPPNCKLQMVMNANELYVAGITTNTLVRQTIINVQKDLTVSTSRNLFGAPKAAFIGENSGSLYAMNVTLNGTDYPDRAYVSSPQKGAITYVNIAMNNTFAPVNLIQQTPAMTGYTTPSGVASASSEAAGGNYAWKAFDRSTGISRWIANSPANEWVEYDFGSGNAKVINYYSIWGECATEVVNRGPKSWTFQASNDNSTWTTLDTQTNVPVWIQNQSDTRTYTTSNTTAYRYYRLNVSANQGADYIAVQELGLYSSVQTTQEMQVKVDTARYIKAGMSIDIYKAGTNTFMYNVSPTSVDNSADTFNFLPYNLTVSSVSTGASTVTVSTTASFPTGTPLLFQSTGTVPGGLTGGTTYYAINSSSTTLQIAATLSDAKIGNPITLTTTGTGTITLYLSYLMNKTDELWLGGRHGDGTPSILWNTDYRNPQTADFLFIAAGGTASTAITGWGKSNNRINIFTSTSMWQYDNANFVPIFQDVGCVSHNTICNNGTFLIWLDSSGRVRARDSASGQDQIISRAIKNGYMDSLTSTNYANASATMFDSNYKLYLGTLNGKSTRLLYNFDMNIWWREAHKRQILYQLVSDISGVERPYFLDEQGNMFQDEIGNLDNTDQIPWYIQYGRRLTLSRYMPSASANRVIQGFYIYSDNAVSALFSVQLPGTDPQWREVGQLTDVITKLPIPDIQQKESRDFNFKLSGSSPGDPARIEGFEMWIYVRQSNF